MSDPAFVVVWPDTRLAIADRRKADAQAQAERVAQMIEERRSGNVRRAVEKEHEYFDNKEARS